MKNKNRYKITSKQKRLLKSFKCIRLKDYNFPNGYNFINKRNKNISNIFNKNGRKEDMKGEKAYYVIVRENKIALFFSIKCGSLFDKPISNIINDFIENKKISQNDIKKMIKAIKDKEKEKNINIKRVSNTYSAIELVHLCSNDNFKKEEWGNIKKDYDIVDKNTMGKILFWYHIVPKIKKINDIIGSKYTYLFAADSSDSDTLIGYYEDLSFKRDDEFSTIKPFYDFSCIFMYQEILELIKKREEYLNRFNESEEDELKSEDNKL